MSLGLEAGLMGFAASIWLYLVIEELMREAHKVTEHPLANWLFFAGFLGLVLLQMQLTH
jgi:zinc transporter ZupT